MGNLFAEAVNVLLLRYLSQNVNQKYLIMNLHTNLRSKFFFFRREVIGNYADIVFANGDEARALCNLCSKDSSISAARYLSHFVPLVAVTDGPRGSYIGMKGEAIYIPPSPCVPVDTCGAGDAYASGILYGVLRGHSDLKSTGLLASRVAATVVGQQGTRLRVYDAGRLVESFTFHLESSGVGSDHISSLWYSFNAFDLWQRKDRNLEKLCKRLYSAYLCYIFVYSKGDLPHFTLPIAAWTSGMWGVHNFILSLNLLRINWFFFSWVPCVAWFKL